MFFPSNHYYCVHQIKFLGSELHNTNRSNSSSHSRQEAPKAMSVKKCHSLDNGEAVKKGEVAKRGRFDRCFSFVEISVEPGKQLKDMDSNKLKSEIKRWAKAVVSYARQK